MRKRTASFDSPTIVPRSGTFKSPALICKTTDWFIQNAKGLFMSNAPPQKEPQARDDSEREAVVAEWYRGSNLLVGRYCYPLRHKSRGVRGTRVPIRWFVGAIVEVQAIRHVRCMSAIYRALIEPLLDQVRRIPKRRESPAPDGLGVALGGGFARGFARSEEHTSELQSLAYLVCRL